MDNSKVLKPIIRPQESAETKKKENNKKKKALIVSALAFLIATGTIWASIAVVKANMPKLEIKFDDWFVDSFDFDSMQAFIDENRLSKGDIDKQLPGYVDKKAKDQNVKNADMITNVRLTNKIPEDKNNKLPHGIYVEMTAELDYAFAYQADLSLEDNPDQDTKQLTSIAEEPKKPRYFINGDKAKLYVLVYERESDSDESLPEDLQTFNDFKISNCPQALHKLNEYISEQSRRYTAEEFEQNNNWEPGWKIFRETLIGLESNYIKSVKFDYDTDNQTGSNQKVMQITLDNIRSNFDFVDANQTNGSVSYSEATGTLTIKNLDYFKENILDLSKLQENIQQYIQDYNEPENDGRYTFSEFQTKMNDPKLLQLIAKDLGIGKEIIPPTPEPETPENPDTEDNGTNPLVDPETPPTTNPNQPTIDTSKIKNLIPDRASKNLIIELKCDEKQKYSVPKEYDKDKYEFDQARDRLIVKGLKYFTEYDLTNTQSIFDNLDHEIIRVPNEYTVSEFSAFATGDDTQQQCKDLIAKNLNANGKQISTDLITKLEVTPIANSDTLATLKITFDNDFKKYKTDQNEQYKINPSDSTMQINLTFFKGVQINSLQSDIQSFIDNTAGEQYTVEEFQEKINDQSNDPQNELQERIKELVTNNVQGSTNVENFSYDKENNELKFQVTIQKYEKFPSEGQNVKYVLNKKNTDGTTVYDVTVSNLLYWYDFTISVDELKKTKQKVADFILNNGICSSEDPDENNYPDFERQIFDLFGETTLENGMLLSEFMTYNKQDFELKDANTFLINLKPKLEQTGSYLKEYRRKFTSVTGLANEVGIEMTEQDKVLSFKNIEFSTTKAFFIIDEKKKEVQGVNEKGRLQSTLKIPAGYPTITHKTLQIEGKTVYGWQKLNKVKQFYITDSVTTMKAYYFLSNADNLQYIKISKKLNVLHSDGFRVSPKLTTIDVSESKDAKLMSEKSSNSFSYYESLQHLLVPKGTDVFSYYSMSNNKNLEYIISWFKKYGGGSYESGFNNTPKFKSMILLADDFEIPTSRSAFKNLYLNKNVKFYITSDALKEKMITNKKQFFETTDEDYVVRDRIVVIENLEQILKEKGHIPSDW